LDAILVVAQDPAVVAAWWQAGIAGFGVFLAGIIAVWASTWQHKSQMRHAAGRDVANLMSILADMEATFALIESFQAPPKGTVMVPDKIFLETGKQLAAGTSRFIPAADVITLTALRDVHDATVNLMSAVRGLTDKVTQAGQTLTGNAGRKNQPVKNRSSSYGKTRSVTTSRKSVQPRTGLYMSPAGFQMS
jgi:hypothetical protein